MRSSTLLVTSLLCGAMLGPATAADADKAIKYRQGVFRVMAWDFGPMGAMVKGKTEFDAAKFAMHAERVTEMSPRMLDGFGKGTEKGDAPTRAKPEIWSDMAGFEAAAKKLEDEAAKLLSVATSGDEAAMKKQFAATGKACKACHDDYRTKK